MDILETAADRLSPLLEHRMNTEFVLSIKRTTKVRPLRTVLHGWQAVWRRCSSLQGAALPRRRALPANLPTAHSGTSNCRF